MPAAEKGLLHFEAGNVEAYGTKVFLAETRSDDDRVILDARSVPARGQGGEAGVATESFERLAALAPGIQTVVYDKALRGVHIDRLYKVGILPVVKVAAANRKARRGDAESVSRALEDTLYLNRAHSEGHLRQTADLLGFALMVNPLTLARHRARERVKTAALALSASIDLFFKHVLTTPEWRRRLVPPRPRAR